MAPSVPFYPLVVLPAAIAVYLFWRRLRLHLAVLRAGRPLNRSDRPVERIKGVLIYVIAQRRLLNDIGPGLAHAFIFWGFLVLLATTGNYLTNGLVEAIVGWPLGGLAWDGLTALANLLIGLIIASIAYVGLRRILARPPRLALSRDAFVILALIGIVVVTELFGDAFRFAADPSLGSRPFAVLAGPLSLLLEPLGVRTATIGFGIFACAHILVRSRKGD